jgi:pyridoxal phosphate enzyme (YggS family)
MIAENIQNIRQRIDSACLRAKRTPDEVTLIAVAKTFGSGEILEAVQAGAKDIGENFVQEMSQKLIDIQDNSIRWHFIGHLQTNKIKYIIDTVYLIHSVDSLRLGKELSSQAGKHGKKVNILVEVNTSNEESKFGVTPDSAPALVKELSLLPHLHLMGLMTIGPFLPDPEESRPAFRTLREVRDALQKEGMALPHLSMGMTNDFEVAIEEGSTMVRIGTAIFGKRTRTSVAER